MDGKGNPIPWYTYPCTSFLGKRVGKNMHVFEYGSGYSTLWWASRAASVTSCEHDRAFHDEIAPQAPGNVTYIYRDPEVFGSYAGAVREQSRKFDIVIVDGQDRVECAKAAPDGLTDAGVVVWDNADRAIYAEGYESLYARGFRRIDFDGHGPIWIKEWTTTVFYRDNNCLGI